MRLQNARSRYSFKPETLDKLGLTKLDYTSQETIYSHLQSIEDSIHRQVLVRQSEEELILDFISSSNCITWIKPKNVMAMKKYIALILFPVLLACSDDFVNVDSFDQDSESFFNSPEDYQSALIAAYDLLQATYINVMLGEIASNNTLAGGESATDVPGIQEIDDMIHTPVNQQLRDIWSWMYAESTAPISS